MHSELYSRATGALRSVDASVPSNRMVRLFPTRGALTAPGVISRVTAGPQGAHFHRNHRCPGPAPIRCWLGGEFELGDPLAHVRPDFEIVFGPGVSDGARAAQQVESLVALSALLQDHRE